MVSPSIPWLEWFSRHLSLTQLLSRMKRGRAASIEGDTVERRPPEQQCLPSLQPYPWLLYFSGEGRNNQTLCSISDPTKTYSSSIPELGASRLCAIQHGWCLLANRIDSGNHIFLWNPYNLKKIELPPLKHNDVIGDCALSSSPTSTDQLCSIFLFSLHTTSIFYCQLGDKRWTEVCYYKDTIRALELRGNFPLKQEEILLINPVYCNGCLYAETLNMSLLVVIEKLEPHGLKINSTGVRLPTLPTTRFQHMRQLLGSDGELFRIEILHAWDRVFVVVVHRYDFSLKKWEKVESIKDRVFFISKDGSCSFFVCPIVNPTIEGGNIYLALGNNNFIYIYNIEDKSVMISQPFSDLPEKRSCLMWFMPDVRMTDILKEEIGNDVFRKNGSICGAIHLKETGDRATNESTLPLDMVEEIAKHLDVLAYLNFRAANRLFRLAAPPVQWRSLSSMSMSRFDDLSLSPLFVCVDKEVLTLVHPKHGLNYKYTINLRKGFTDCEICCSKDGWLLARNTRYSFFFNPFTKQVLQRAYNKAQCIGFSHPPTSSECVIIELNRTIVSSSMMAMITCHGNFYWGDFKFKDSYFHLYNISPAFHKGAFYCLSKEGKLGVIKVTKGSRASWKELKKPQAPCTGHFNSFLVECDDSLLSVFEDPFGKWVRVFKLNESSMTWIKIENLENRMLFVGNTSFSVVANIPGMENKIYFPRFYGQSIVFYSLETNNYHTFENEVVNFRHVREKLNSGWIEPRWY